jgi:hypothetical protein
MTLEGHGSRASGAPPEKRPGNHRITTEFLVPGVLTPHIGGDTLTRLLSMVSRVLIPLPRGLKR